LRYLVCMSIQKTTLPNGLRVISDTVSSVDSVAMGVWTDVGTRNENLVHNGVAHMVEHMMFKGTPTRSAVQIAEQIEDVGGQVNAYTSREVTAYHIHLLKEHTGLGLEILADIIQHTIMPDDELERERHVILQEIGMSVDTPDDLVFDHYQEIAYPDQALGAPILGTTDIVSGMTRDTLLDYVRRFYTPSRLVISAAGNVAHDDLVAMVTEQFTDLPDDTAYSHVPACYEGGEHRMEKDLEQSHIILGFRGVSRADDDYFSAVMLATILGGGMSSRLFQEVREKRGLVYSVFSFHSPYQDDGQLAIYAGTGPKDIPDLIPVLCEEVQKMSNTVTEGELARAKAQVKAAMLMGRESMMSRAGQQAKHLIFFDKILDMQEKLRKIEEVQVGDVHKIAQRIFASRPTLAALGPLATLEGYDAISGRLAA